ncbi:MAG: 3',5'-cyclic-AMP phosphodiesterase, partial [Cellvibrionaceae bacterium]|nr:3',5'-cyclic-AMP phosphodiesterase [Cellvibrionaceae bacterium]
PYTHVKLILWGHIHQEFDALHEGVRLLASPSTCIQFAPGKNEFTLDKTMPGYRWLELHDDGSISTHVERLPYKDYGIDYQSEGY